MLTDRMPPPVRARHGDLAVVISSPRSTFVQGGGQETLRVVLGRVSGVTREGVVTRYKEPTFAGDDGRERKVGSHEKVLIVGAADADVEAILADYRAHTWRTTTGADSDMVRPYESMEQAKTAVRKRRYQQ